MTTLKTGDVAPQFHAQSTCGELSFESALESSENGVIVYFYPKANTPGCTKEACDFQDSLNSLKGAGYAVIGISADSLESLERFSEKQSLNFPLVSDPTHEILDAWGAWGAWGEKKNYGRTYVGIIRSTVVVGKDGHVISAYYNVKATGHVARLRRELGVD